MLIASIVVVHVLLTLPEIDPMVHVLSDAVSWVGALKILGFGVWGWCRSLHLVHKLIIGALS